MADIFPYRISWRQQCPSSCKAFRRSWDPRNRLCASKMALDGEILILEMLDALSPICSYSKTLDSWDWASKGKYLIENPLKAGSASILTWKLIYSPPGVSEVRKQYPQMFLESRRIPLGLALGTSTCLVKRRPDTPGNDGAWDNERPSSVLPLPCNTATPLGLAHGYQWEILSFPESCFSLLSFP